MTPTSHVQAWEVRHLCKQESDHFSPTAISWTLDNYPLAILPFWDFSFSLVWLNEKSQNGSVTLPFSRKSYSVIIRHCLSTGILERVFGGRMSFLTPTSTSMWNNSEVIAQFIKEILTSRRNESKFRISEMNLNSEIQKWIWIQNFRNES